MEEICIQVVRRMYQHHGRDYFALPWRCWVMVIAQGGEGLPLWSGCDVTDAVYWVGREFSCPVEGLAYGVNRTYKLHKHVIRENPRKLLQLDAVLDYDNAGPNTKHDPRGKKGGGSGNHP
ncbi:hypothetical protein FXO38_33543 [Capsicum annuum]|nr:hypothetical protein FXO38_33543 [Capsicum annuum]KAF3662947.1 hypothetical protein FXO37_12238 [Capsicum annuum]